MRRRSRQGWRLAHGHGGEILALGSPCRRRSTTPRWWRGGTLLRQRVRRLRRLLLPCLCCHQGRRRLSRSRIHIDLLLRRRAARVLTWKGSLLWGRTGLWSPTVSCRSRLSVRHATLHQFQGLAARHDAINYAVVHAIDPRKRETIGQLCQPLQRNHPCFFLSRW